jgi:hypothetical protein
MKRRITLIVLSVLLALLPVGLVKAENWVEVTRYEGQGSPFSPVTGTFTCNYSEWRIKYESYVSGHAHFLEMYMLTVTTYRQGENTTYIDRIDSEPTQGNYYYHLIRNQTGTFYMNITVGMVDSYSVKVEQNLDSYLVTPTPIASPSASATPSIPEFPLVSAIFLLAVASIALVYFRRRKEKP